LAAAGRCHFSIRAAVIPIEPAPAPMMLVPIELAPLGMLSIKLFTKVNYFTDLDTRVVTIEFKLFLLIK
jgi:hypothetical protein